MKFQLRVCNFSPLTSILISFVSNFRVSVTPIFLLFLLFPRNFYIHNTWVNKLKNKMTSRVKNNFQKGGGVKFSRKYTFSGITFNDTKNCIIYTTGLYINVAFVPILVVSCDILKRSTNNYTYRPCKNSIVIKIPYFFRS